MKNASNLSLVILFLMVLGCGCPANLAELGKEDKPPATPIPAFTPVSATNTATSTVTSKGEYEVNMEKFNQIKTGMKRSEVETIMGGKGTEYYSGKGGGMSFVSTKYVGDNYKTIFVSYRNDKVTSKSQAGLN